MPEVRSRVILQGREDFRIVGLLVDPSCTMRVNLVCSPESPCASPPPVPVLHSTSEPDEGSAGTSATCTSVTSARSNTWTLGYGGPGDVLTKVEVTDYFNTGCSDGVARLGSYSGFCQWASWNGWQKNACYYATNAIPPGWAAQGVVGTFECHNSNFCRDNIFLHSLFTEAESNNIGTVYCDHGQSGTVPPKTDGTSQTYYSCQPA